MSAFDKAVTMSMTLLQDIPQPTPAQVEQYADLVIRMLQNTNPDEPIDRDRLINQITHRCNVSIGHEMVLEDPTGHKEWLIKAKGDVDWRFWKRYREFLLTKQNWNHVIVNRLDDLTDRILGLLEDPKRDGAWDRRGMVVGQVQSGKTSNYVGLICKAADAGYRVIIVLAGMHNNLRSQTQERIDEGFYGFNSERALAFNEPTPRVGVGLVRTAGASPVVHTPTTSGETGDFRRPVADQMGIVPGSDPIFLVIKKNKSILQNLLQWLAVHTRSDLRDNARRIMEVPLLLIDDEADNASVNTKEIPTDETGRPLDDYDVTAINGLIRQILDVFEKSAYVGYTATPFANIFIDEDDETIRHGEGLFPRSFIMSLPAASSYVGPERVFGLDRAPEAGILDEQDGLPVIRPADDADTWIPPRHKITDLPQGDLPLSLKEALRAFILCCAARRARGHVNEHNSMLIHVTRFTGIQGVVEHAVRDELQSLQSRLRYGEGARKTSLRDELRNLWENDFSQTTEEIVQRGIDDHEVRVMPWNLIEPQLIEAANGIVLRVINGSAADILDYRKHSEGINVIVIGGDKLSRGLTLQGLSISYFLRSSRMYDTLMQMGRWFGYRPGYIDLCRLYTSHDLADWYRHITLASAELKREFEHMAAIGATPRDYGLRVRTHPNGLKITQGSKLRTGAKMRVSFSGRIAETIIFHRSENALRANFQATEALLTGLQTSGVTRSDDKSRIKWTGVSADRILNFLRAYQTHPQALKANAALMADFIQQKNSDQKLTNWTVTLLTGGQAEGAPIQPVGEIKYNQRTVASPLQDDDRFSIRRLVSPSDEKADLSDAELAEAERRRTERIGAGGDDAETALGFYIRDVRPEDRGLLLLYPVQLYDRENNPIATGQSVIGIALSFPSSKTGIDRGIEYHVNNRYLDEI